MLTIDLETRSRCDIEACGSWVYSLDESTEPLCIAIGDASGITVHEINPGAPCPSQLADAINNGTPINAFNVAFELGIFEHVLGPKYGWPVPARTQWRDTQAKCLTSAMPGKLERVALMLGLDEQKDTKGKVLINYFCKPITAGHRKGELRDRSEDPARFQQLMDYCAQDVRTTLAVDNELPDLSADELRFWQVTLEQNIRGIQVDHALVRGLQAMTDTTAHLLGDKLAEETDGSITVADMSNHRKILRFIQAEGVNTVSVAKPSVRDALEEDISAKARVVLEARQALGKTSTAKLDKMLAMSPDGRVRFQHRHHGTLTGRDSGLDLQVQNFPRGEKMDPAPLCEAASRGDTEAFLAAAYKKQGKGPSARKIHDPMGAVITCLRGCLVAAPGHTLCQMDWNAVEPRIISWLAGEAQMLNGFRDIDAGRTKADCYQIAAAPFFGLDDPLQVIGDMRQFGKVYMLQNQYQSGPKSVQSAAKQQYGLTLDDDTAVLCVDTYRATYRRIVAFWKDCDKAAIWCTKNHGKVLRVGKIAFQHDGTHLRMRLPSGRKLTYPFARVDMVLTEWGPREQVIFRAIHQQSGNIVDCPMHGGVWANNATQGTGACLMRHAVLNLYRDNLTPVLRLHDELIIEYPTLDAEKGAAILRRAMLDRPAWAEDLPLNGAGWQGQRFHKD